MVTNIKILDSTFKRIFAQQWAYSVFSKQWFIKMRYLGMAEFGAVTLIGRESPYHTAASGLPATSSSTRMLGRFSVLASLNHPHLCKYVELARSATRMFCCCYYFYCCSDNIRFVRIGFLEKIRFWIFILLLSCGYWILAIVGPLSFHNPGSVSMARNPGKLFLQDPLTRLDGVLLLSRLSYRERKPLSTYSSKVLRRESKWHPCLRLIH